jgi:hypothetical protein
MRRLSLLSAIALLAAGSVAALAQDKTIDDFTTGNYQSPVYYYGAAHDSIQYGSMMGLSRDTNMNVCSLNYRCPAGNTGISRRPTASRQSLPATTPPWCRPPASSPRHASTWLTASTAT